MAEKEKPIPAIARPVVVDSPGVLGRVMRRFRQGNHLRLTDVRDKSLGNVGIRFLSEIERGKENASIGKILEALNAMGLELVVREKNYLRVEPMPRDYLQQKEAERQKEVQALESRGGIPLSKQQGPSRRWKVAKPA